MIFVRYPFHCDLKLLDYGKNSVRADLIKDNIASHLGYGQFSLLYNGKQLHDAEIVPDDSTVQVIFSLPGGKGGFGSMLRAIGAQIEKTTNREACRDLSGRRLRDINEEQRLKKWIAKEAEREAEKIKRRQARIERLKSKAPHKFFDFEYEKKISELPNRIDDALNEGLQKVKQPNKRPVEKLELPKKSWLSDDFSVSSSDSESDETNAAADGSAPKKPKMTPKDSSSCDSDISESSQPQPCSSKDYSFAMEETSTSSDSKLASIEEKSKDNAADLDKVDLEAGQILRNALERGKYNEDPNVTPTSETKITETEKNKSKCSTEEIMEVEKRTEEDCKAAPISDNTSITKEPDTEDESPIDLQEFQSVSELEALGLDRLKSALMARGLKCGGTLSDRAQRLWKVRGFQPHEYPANLLAKTKK